MAVPEIVHTDALYACSLCPLLYGSIKPGRGHSREDPFIWIRVIDLAEQALQLLYQKVRYRDYTAAVIRLWLCDGVDPVKTVKGSPDGDGLFCRVKILYSQGQKLPAADTGIKQGHKGGPQDGILYSGEKQPELVHSPEVHASVYFPDCFHKAAGIGRQAIIFDCKIEHSGQVVIGGVLGVLTQGRFLNFPCQLRTSAGVISFSFLSLQNGRMCFFMRQVRVLYVDSLVWVARSSAYRS